MNSPHYSSYTSGAPIYSSRTVRRVPVGRRDHLISYGDRISVRVVMEGRKVLDYQTRQVADMTDITSDLRRRAKDMKGLAVITIRNHDRGWTSERHIKLYPKRQFATTGKIDAVPVPMFFPWEL